LTVTLDPFTVPLAKPRDIVTFKGRVTSDGLGVGGVSVQIWHAAAEVNIVSGTTDVNGYFSIPWTVPWVVGTLPQVTLPCATHNFYAWTPNAPTSNIQSLPIAYSTRIRNGAGQVGKIDAPTSVLPGAPFGCSGYLEYETASGVWSGLATRPITVQYDTSSFGSGSTASNGLFQISGSIPTSGTKTLTARFAGENLPAGYLAALGTIELGIGVEEGIVPFFLMLAAIITGIGMTASSEAR